MIIRKAFKFKLKPTKRQEADFRRYAGAARWVWNEFLTERKRAYGLTGETPSYNDQFKRLTELKKQPETAWLNDIHSQVLQESVKNLRQAFQNFFEGHANYPKFKSKKHLHQSFAYPQGVKTDKRRVYLPKIGWVRFYKSRDIEGTIKRAMVKRHASGWYVSIQVELSLDDPEPVAPTLANSIGIDLGLGDFVVTSDREHTPNPGHLRKLEQKLAREQRKLSRKKRGSNRYRKQRQKVAKLHEEVANVRKDFLHKLSTRLVSENQAIIAEDLAVNGLGRTPLAKSVYDAGWAEFLRQLEYKAEWQGKTFHRINRSFPSTKLHAHCGTLNDVSLSDRVFACRGCGEIIYRDENAAVNIKFKGLMDLNVAVGQPETLNARGERVRLAYLASNVL